MTHTNPLTGMTDVSQERIERAAMEIMRVALGGGIVGDGLRNRWYEDDKLRANCLDYARAALTVDASALVAANMRGLKTAREIAANEGPFLRPGEEAILLITRIDARIDALQKEIGGG